MVARIMAFERLDVDREVEMEGADGVDMVGGSEAVEEGWSGY